MVESTVKVLLIPRYGSFAGDGPFYTVPLNVREFESADLTAWASVSVVVTVEQSTDMEHWTAISGGGIVTGSGVEATLTKAFTLEWMRLRVNVSGLPRLTSVWVVGNFVRRRSAAA